MKNCFLENRSADPGFGARKPLTGFRARTAGSNQGLSTPAWRRETLVLNRVTLSVPRRPARTTLPLTWLCQVRIDSSRHPALPARNNDGKSWQSLYQRIRTHERALTAGLIPAEVFSFALLWLRFVLRRCFRRILTISRRFNRESHWDHFGIYRLRAFHIRTKSRAISSRSVIAGLFARG